MSSGGDKSIRHRWKRQTGLAWDSRSQVQPIQQRIHHTVNIQKRLLSQRGGRSQSAGMEGERRATSSYLNSNMCTCWRGDIIERGREREGEGDGESDLMTVCLLTCCNLALER